MFSREAGLYMWRSIPFDKIGWDNVEQHYKDALMNHLLENFNFDEVERDIEAKNLTGGIRAVLMKRYSDHKHDAKELFKSKGGYNDLESARAFHPPDMPYDNWLRTIEGFREEKYIKRSKANTLVREKQQFPHLRTDMDWVPTYAKTHTDKQGNWVDPVVEQNYDFVNSLFQTPSFLNQLNNYLASQGKGKSKDYDSDNLFDNESDDEPNDNDDDQ
ncbi:hypothetical protein Hdeb2414_s0011g00367271 [Helianthus debilis subsp. tardiflorus]